MVLMLQQCRSLLNCGSVHTFLDRATLVDRVITGVGSGIFTRPCVVHGMAVVPIWPVSHLVLVRAAIVDQQEGLMPAVQSSDKTTEPGQTFHRAQEGGLQHRHR